MKHYFNLDKSVGHPIAGLQTNPYMSEVWVLDHPDATHRAHFFKGNEVKFNAKGVLVLKENNTVCRTIPSAADMVKLKRGFGWKLESFAHPLYALVGELAFKRWLKSPDVREALIKNDAQFIKECDPLFHSVLMLYGKSCSEVRPKKVGIWPYDMISWNSKIRLQVDGVECRGNRKMAYNFGKNPRVDNGTNIEFRLDAGNWRNKLPSITIARRYPVESWPNTKQFSLAEENRPYFAALFHEMTSGSRQ